MPRLLLVDDNPSIHRIAESLLAPTDVEVVCSPSGADALDRIRRGERFDVALVDTAMPGMDGWALLQHFQEEEGTARMPVALMAGVLDPVDPVRLAQAPIRGFLKKPIELKDLGERVKGFMAAPVALAEPLPAADPSPAPPGSLLDRLERRLEPEEPSDGPVEPEADLLLLGAEDLWPEEAPAPVEAEAPEEGPVLELAIEELDLEELEELGPEASPEADIPADPAGENLEAGPHGEAEGPALEEPLDALPQAPAVPESGSPLEAPAPPSPELQALVQALLADPALLDRLAQAVAERLRG